MSSDGSDLRKAVAGVVAVAAGLLIANIILAVIVARRSRRVRERLDRLRETTADLRTVPEISGQLEQMTRSLQAIRQGHVG